MKIDHDAGGIGNVVSTATKYVETTDKVVTLIQKTDNLGKKVGLKRSAMIGLAACGALALAFFPLRLKYDSQTGEGEYKSLVVGVKRTQRPTRPADGDKTHSLSWEIFPTVRPRPESIRLDELPPAKMREPVKAAPMTAAKVQKAQVQVPVKLSVQEVESCPE